MSLRPLAALALGAAACVDFDATRAQVCAQRPELCDGGSAGGAAGSAGGAAGGSAGSSTSGGTGGTGGGSATAGGGGAVGGGSASSGGAGGAAAPRLVFIGPDGGELSTGVAAHLMTVPPEGTGTRGLALRNAGGGTLGPLALDLIDGGTWFAVDGGACQGTMLGPSSQCDFSVAFTPRTEGTLAAILRATAPDAAVGQYVSATGWDDAGTLFVTLVSDAGRPGRVDVRWSGGSARVEALGTFAVKTPRSVTQVDVFPHTVRGAALERCNTSTNEQLSFSVSGGTRFFGTVTCHFPPANVVFVTEATVVPGTLGAAGPAEDAADAICGAAARDGGLPGRFVSFLALYRDGGAPDASVRLDAYGRTRNAGGWVRVDGQPVFRRELVGVSTDERDPFFQPNFTEHGRPLPAGEPAVVGSQLPGGGDCSAFRSTGGQTVRGFPDRTVWATESNNHPCSAPAHLYCFQVDRSLREYPAAPDGARLAFVTDRTWVPDGGRGSADFLCNDEAATSLVPGTFRALLAGDGTTAAARLDAGGPTWVRLDGIPLGDDAAQVMRGEWAVPLRMRADGIGAQGLPWTGAVSPRAPGTAASTCGNWSPGGTTGVFGDSQAVYTSLDAGSRACTPDAGPIYCLQE